MESISVTLDSARFDNTLKAIPITPENTMPYIKALSSTEPAERAVDIAKVDDERRLVFGWASVAVTKDGSTVVDHEGDMIDPRDLEDAAYSFVLKFGEANVNHTGPVVGRVVESFVSTPDKLTALGLPADALPVGWWAGWYVEDDDAWAGVKSGKFKSFSIEGIGTREAA